MSGGSYDYPVKGESPLDTVRREMTIRLVLARLTQAWRSNPTNIVLPAPMKGRVANG